MIILLIKIKLLPSLNKPLAFNGIQFIIADNIPIVPDRNKNNFNTLLSTILKLKEEIL